DRRPRRCSGSPDSATTWGNSKGNRCSSTASGGTCTRTGSSASCGTGTGTTGTRTAAAAEAAEPDSTTTAANIHASDIALAHHSVPGGPGLAGFVGVDSGDVDDVGIGDTGDGAILVVEDRGLVDRIAVIIVAPSVVNRREIHRLALVRISRV